MKIPKKILLSTFVIIFNLQYVFAQDPQLSQFYNQQIYHNPAFTGHTGGSRLMASSRLQWFGLGLPYKTYMASYDTYIDNGVSVGGQVIHDEQSSNFQTNTVSGLFSRWWEFGLTMGIKASYVNRGINLDNLKFIDQYSSSGIATQSQDPLAKANNFNQNFGDFSFGALYEKHFGESDEFNPNKKGIQFGLSVNHIDKILYGQDFTLPLPQIGVHGSWKIPIDFKFWYRDENREESTLTLTGYFRKQGKNMMLDFGPTIRFSPIILGLWYRGLPIRLYDKTPQQDALVVLMGYEQEKFRVGLSYDVTVSSLGWNSGGTAELSLWFGLGNVNFTGTKSNFTPKPNCEKFRRHRSW
jgi:type IX secretion system PorP/SprF family membrane protein